MEMSKGQRWALKQALPESAKSTGSLPALPWIRKMVTIAQVELTMSSLFYMNAIARVELTLSSLFLMNDIARVE